MCKRMFVIILITILFFSYILVSKQLKKAFTNNNSTINDTIQESISENDSIVFTNYSYDKNNPTEYIITDKEKIKEIESSKKYYLHDSNLEKPSKEKCETAQKKALYGLNELEIQNVQKILRETHVMLEYRLIDAVKLIKDPDSPYWAKFTVDEVYVDPSSGNKVKSDGFYNNVEDLKKIENIIKEPKTKEKIKEIYTKLQKAMNEHDLEECFKIHEIIHDYDYWIINYPVYFETFSPPDWSGIDVYFGNV